MQISAKEKYEHTVEQTSWDGGRDAQDVFGLLCFVQPYYVLRYFVPRTSIDCTSALQTKHILSMFNEKRTHCPRIWPCLLPTNVREKANLENPQVPICLAMLTAAISS